MAVALKGRYGSGIEPLTYLGQSYFNVDKSVAYEVLEILHRDQNFDYCVDVTAVHYPKRTGKEFEVVWILYSHQRNERIRVKTAIGDGEPAPSVTKLWRTANWLEREAYDMFGIVFQGHPDLRRILMPDGWKGHPLRKDYSILKQDTDWVKANIGIESAQ
jgi:NADH-quinone oxidoreductase subunit C